LGVGALGLYINRDCFLIPVLAEYFRWKRLGKDCIMEHIPRSIEYLIKHEKTVLVLAYIMRKYPMRKYPMRKYPDEKIAEMREFVHQYQALYVQIQAYLQESLPAQAERIAQEFYNQRCTAYEGGHFVEQTEENRANVIARVKRYFRNSKNFAHIKRLDIDHFANEVFGESKIPRSSAARAELETFLKDQIEKLPEIEAPPPLRQSGA
jgi:hypothetical protein